MAAKWALEASWMFLGALKKAWSAGRGFSGAYGALLDASWSRLGAIKIVAKRPEGDRGEVEGR